MRKIAIALGAAVIVLMPAALAQQKPAIDPVKVDAAIKSAFPSAPADWAPRLMPDETMKQCSAHGNLPPQMVADAIMAREKATIEYPADGKFVGDWKKGEQVAQSGFRPALHRLSAGQSHEWRQLLCLPSTYQGGGELWHDWPEPFGIRHDSQIRRSGNQGSLREGIQRACIVPLLVDATAGCQQGAHHRANKRHRRIADEPREPG